MCEASAVFSPVCYYNDDMCYGLLVKTLTKQLSKMIDIVIK